MDKNAIKKYATWARRELISRVRQKAYQYGIRENDIIDANADSIDGKILTNSEKRERRALIAQVKEKGFEQVMEEVAYTWFNRFSALRFMEVNGYLPTHVRVFTDDDNNFKPQIIAEAIHMELDGLDMEKIYALKDADNNDELFKYLLITQCNALNEILPGMFQQIADYTELLFPDNLLREGSIIEQMISLVPEDDWKDAVEIIGWLYQYYNAEPKDLLINAKKIYKDKDIPFVTQLFTSDWIVRFMVENSLGRLWLEGHPDDELKSRWTYYLDESNVVKFQTAEIQAKNKLLKPEEIKVMDCCMGSGHILVYAFDVLLQIYEAYGYNRKEAVKSIIENNLYGLDIDERATQLAYFAVMMKARQYDRRIFKEAEKGLHLNIYEIKDGAILTDEIVDFIANGDATIHSDLYSIRHDLKDAKLLGSIIELQPVNFEKIYQRIEDIKGEYYSDIFEQINQKIVVEEALPIIEQAQTMSINYEVVVTNPPYMAAKYMPAALKTYVADKYADYKADLFATFIVRCKKMCAPYGHLGFLTPYVWMFIQSYDKLRKFILNNMTFSSIVQLEYNAFEAAMVPVGIYTFRNYFSDIPFEGIRLSDFKGINVQATKVLEAINNEYCGYRYNTKQSNFQKIPGSSIAYWANESIINKFEQTKIGDFLTTREGMATANNNLFLRFWFEISIDKSSILETDFPKWIPYNKGGSYRKWYGNNEYLVNWENDGFEIKNNIDSSTGRIRSHNYNGEFALKEGITWSSISSGNISFRYSPLGFMFDSKGAMGFSKDIIDIRIIQAFLNSKIAMKYLEFISPTLDFKVGDIIEIPFLYGGISKSLTTKLIYKCNSNIFISKSDWDSFETSWDFETHPFIDHQQDSTKISDSFETWSQAVEARFNQLKANEEELNRIFIDIYGLQDELTPEIEDKDVTVSKADLQRDIKSLISYAVGCMFGRYSLDIEGLAYAGGEWDASKYHTYPVDADNIIPISDDEYFSDDIVGYFVKFIETVYGLPALEENLKFIADALGCKGSPREVIRSYFMNDFYDDHCKMYQKRPIYWLFDSGKKNGLKALIYIHRYQPDTIARMRTDYVHEQQERYRTAITHLEERIDNSPTSERVKLNKQLGTLKDQATEIRVYEEKIHHLADQMIHIDLDDGVKKNYEIFKDVLAKIK